MRGDERNMRVHPHIRLGHESKYMAHVCVDTSYYYYNVNDVRIEYCLDMQFALSLL